MRTLPVVKCTISTENEEVDVSRYIDECDMLETLLSRDKTSGVLATVTFPVNFVGAAREYIKRLFDKDGLYAKARLNIYLREDYGSRYELAKSISLDFSTYKEYEERVTIECAEEEFVELINSEGKTKYEIPVQDVKDDNGNVVEEGVCEKKQWDYQRMTLVNNGEYRIPLYPPMSSIGKEVETFLLSISNDSAEQVPNSIKGDFKGQESKTNNTDDYFFKALDDIPYANELSIRTKFSMHFDIFIGAKLSPIDYPRAADALKRVYLGFFKKNKAGETVLMSQMIQFSDAKNLQSKQEGLKWKFSGTLEVETSTGGEAYAGEEYKLMIRYDAPNSNVRMNDLICEVVNFEYFKVKYFAKSSNGVSIDVIDPERLMQRYVDKMSGTKGYYRVVIDWGGDAGKKEDYETKIVAAESIRQIPGAKLYGSPKDFLEWMQVLGYEYGYDPERRELVFKPRKDFFKRNVAAMGLKEHELADLIVQADSTYAYTSIEIGYDKHDYGNVNGRCEVNGTFCYTTGFIARKDNKLKLISPYRADSMGIEFLCQEVDKDTTDTKSDKDVFFVALTDGEDGSNYVEYRGIEIRDADLDLSMFNAPFIPYYLVKRNASLIGINCKKLKFKSTNMNGNAWMPGAATLHEIFGDHEITEEPLFDPIEYNFAAGHWQKIPDVKRRNGLVYFEWKGKMLKGFIKEIRKNYVAETETTWILWAVK